VARASGLSGDPAGFSIIELTLAVAIASTLTAIAVPQAVHALDEYQTRAAAHYLAMRLADARFGAIKRSAYVGFRFEAVGADYRFTGVMDGNGNGLRTFDVGRGEDPVIAAPDMLAWHFSGVTFGILAGVPDADGDPAGTTDGVRVGSSRLISMNPNGSSTPGTLYVRGRGRAQYAVRVLGATGRVRVVRFDPVRRVWGES
jgi:prepilin-type N-terminal cleavage/methylation domain-containing protein